jgi:hypothetical protein
MSDSFIQRAIAAGITVRTIAVNETGDAVSLVLRLGETGNKRNHPNVPCAAVLMTENGSCLRIAKDALEAVIEHGEGRIVLERVQDLDSVLAALRGFGIEATREGPGD